MYFLATARAVIPRHWRSTEVPSLGDWVTELDPIRDLKCLLAQEMEKSCNFPSPRLHGPCSVTQLSLSSWLIGNQIQIPHSLDEVSLYSKSFLPFFLLYCLSMYLQLHLEHQLRKDIKTVCDLCIIPLSQRKLLSAYYMMP